MEYQLGSCISDLLLNEFWIGAYRYERRFVELYLHIQVRCLDVFFLFFLLLIKALFLLFVLFGILSEKIEIVPWFRVYMLIPFSWILM